MGLSVAYRCLRGVSLELEDLTVVVGPNGAGKTSLAEAVYLAASVGFKTFTRNALALVVLSRGQPYAPPGEGEMWLGDRRVVVGQRDCGGLSDELGKAKEAYAVQAFFGYMAKLAGYPIPDWYVKEVGRAYVCSSDGDAAAVSIYANMIVDVAKGGEAKAVYVNARLAGDVEYTSSLIDAVLSKDPSWYMEVLQKLDLVDVRNIAGVPHIFSKRGPRPISQEAGGLAYAAVMSLAFGAGDFVVIDEPETHMHLGMLAKFRDVVELALKRGKKVFVTTHSLEVVDLLTELGVGVLVRLRDCEVYDVLDAEEAQRRISELYEDVRLY